MKYFYGVPKNVDRSIMGRVDSHRQHRRWFVNEKVPRIILVSQTEHNLPRAEAYLVSDAIHGFKSSLPHIENIPQEMLNELQEGDVVLLSNDGKVTVLYSINSHHNAVFATNRCNLKCIMCPQPTFTEQDNSVDFNVSLIKLMNPQKTNNLAITGGEPTLLDDGFFTLIDICKTHLPKTSLTILTNGKNFKNLEFTKKLAMLQHPDITMAVPLYSDNDDIHDTIVGVKKSFYDTIKGLHNLALFGFKVEIRTVLHSVNYSRLPQLSEFIYRNFPFVSHIALMGMETTGLAKENIEELWVDPFDYVNQLEKSVKFLHRAGMNVSIYNLQLCILPPKLWPFCRKSISDWKNVYHEICINCVERKNCAGFFKTSGNHYSSHIKRILPCPNGKQ